MWYFSWVLGLGFAVTLAVLNAMWLDAREQRDGKSASLACGSCGKARTCLSGSRAPRCGQEAR